MYFIPQPRKIEYKEAGEGQNGFVLSYQGYIVLDPSCGNRITRQAALVQKALEEKLGSNEERMERMRQTIEGGLEKISVENRQQLEQMRQTVDEKLNATVDQRLEASFSVVTKTPRWPEVPEDKPTATSPFISVKSRVCSPRIAISKA